ncbi:NXPE family member 3-like [Discoglossus pictus]
MPVLSSVPRVDEELQNLLKLIEWPLPPGPITLESSTDPKSCVFVLLHPRSTYVVGEKLEVLITARDHNGRPKTHGGDFFMAKLHSTKLRAGVSGSMTDHYNGTYTATFLLMWPGETEISVKLVYSSEAISILHEKRDSRPDMIYFFGYFERDGIREKVECNVDIPGQNVCKYHDPSNGETWVCVQPKELPCDAYREHSPGGSRQILTKEEEGFLKTLYVRKSQRFGVTGGVILHCEDIMFAGAARLGKGSYDVHGYPRERFFNYGHGDQFSLWVVSPLTYALTYLARLAIRPDIIGYPRPEKGSGLPDIPSCVFPSVLPEERRAQFSITPAVFDIRLDMVVKLFQEYQLQNLLRGGGLATVNPVRGRDRVSGFASLMDQTISSKLLLLRVLPQNETHKNDTRGACVPGLQNPDPSGFYYQDVWESRVCLAHSFNHPSSVASCLRGKVIYMFGDSTLRQWWDYLVDYVPSLKAIDLHVPHQSGPLLATDTEHNYLVQWRVHQKPLRMQASVQDLHYIASELDQLGSRKGMVIVFNCWAHFSTYPVAVYVERLRGIRNAVNRLLKLSPETKILIKSANTGNNLAHTNKWLSLQLDTVMRAMFFKMPVTILDAWQMTYSHRLPENLHPQKPIVKNEVDLMLSFICPT